MLLQITRVDPVPVSPNPVPCIASKRRFFGRKSKRRDSSWWTKGISCAIRTIPEARIRRTRRNRRTNSCSNSSSPERGMPGLAHSSLQAWQWRNASGSAKCAHMFEPNRGLSMNRRKLLKAATLAAASCAISAPAIAQSARALRWRLATTFPKSLDTLYGACEMFSKAIAELSDQKFQIGVFGPGEIVPPFQVLDAVGNNTVEMGNSASYYYIGKDPAFAFGTADPFGLNTRQMNAWLAYGGGLDLLHELYRPYNV